jgi:DNA polymerase-3 subunit epsilon
VAPYALKPWPYPGTIAVREANVTRERTDVHLFRDWCWLGTAHDEGEFGDMLEYPRRAEFDLDIYRLLRKRLVGATVTTVAQADTPRRPQAGSDRVATDLD